MARIFSNWRRNELIEGLVQPGETDTARFETIAHAVRGDVLWQVLRYSSKEPAVIELIAGHSTTLIRCTLLERSSGWWGYSITEEAAHPRFCSCPLKYLAMAPERCSEWREAVRAYHAGRRVVATDGRTFPAIQQAAFA